ncbi:MAG: zinc metallopeptidase [Anaerolineales bacterium]|nr:zinc metallopeptidase [Anaerolineales bacterium]
MYPLFNLNYLIFMLPAFILMIATQWYVKAAYQRWSRVASRGQMTGLQAAQRLIQSAALYNVRVEEIPGHMTDHYDPRSKTLRLSQGTARTPSVAALAIAAHELGHAIQDQEGYLPLKFRAAIVPAVNIGSYLGWFFIFVGLFFNATNLAVLGLVFFSGGVVFALATLPVELNASARARTLLANSGLIWGNEEEKGVNAVLNAAALTYVAALVTAILQLLYYANLIFGRRR